MSSIKINPTNIELHPWIWDFLEQQREAGYFIWHNNQVHTYNEISFEFENTVFVRERKENNKIHGVAYEMMCPDRIVDGNVGAVFHIACTISLGKNNFFQVRNKKRVVKVQDPHKALYEYQAAEHTKHLHVKKPIEGRMVMKDLPGQTLYSVIKSQYLSPKDRLALTKSLIKAYQEEVSDNKIFHRDLHHKNVLVRAIPSLIPEFEVHIIDFGSAVYNTNFENGNKYISELCEIVRYVWCEEHDVPPNVYNLLWTYNLFRAFF